MDFSKVPAQEVVVLWSSGAVTAMVAGLAAVFIVVVAVGTWLGGVVLKHSREPRAVKTGWLRRADGPSRLVALLVYLNLLLVQGGGAATAFFRTSVVNSTAEEYFGLLSTARLMGISHAHLFGFTMMTGVMALLVAGCDVSARLRSLIISVLLSAGLIDVVSWWGIREVSGRFEAVAMLSGAASAIAGLVGGVLVIRAILVRDRLSPEKSRSD